jgi:hypothetical protein
MTIESGLEYWQVTVLLITVSRTSLRLAEAYVQQICKLAQEAYYSSPTSAEVKKTWLYTPLPC